MDPNKLGPWSMIRILGTGGFGLVALWNNENTGENIAIKSLREKELHDVIQAKHKARWCNEVEIMKKLKHDNVVAALDVPAELISLESASPILAMEYCKLGDLRQELIKPENCCGFKESAVFNILRDVSRGLAYLHSCKIIHRDLKPDNIVMQDGAERVVYKLTDLGFAKELDQNSLCESFVGTVQYLAPELFLGKQYTSAVDFWSFGVVAHEIITGHRPFLPGSAPVTWMKHIQGKKRNVISVLHSWNGEIIHSSSLSKVNNFASCLRGETEKWLQLALDWDNKTRGRDLETNQITLFTSLNDFLDKQVIRVFSVSTCEILSYVVRRDTSVLNLQSWIAKETGLESDSQNLFLPDGKSLNQKANLMNNLPEQRTPEDIALYLFSPGLIKMRSKPVLQPISIRELLNDPKKLLEYNHLKRSSSDAVFFLHSEATFYRNLLNALKAKINNLTQRCAALKSLFEDAFDEYNHTEAICGFFILSHKTDLETYIEARKAGLMPTSELVQKWIKKANDLESKMKDIRKSVNKSQMKIETENILRISSILVNHSLMKNTRSPLDDLLDEGLKLYHRVQNIPKDVRGHPMCNTDIIRLVNKSMESSARLLRSAELDDLYLKIFEVDDHLAKLISPLTILLKSSKVMASLYETTQKERQRDVWGLLNQTYVKPTLETSKLEEPSAKSPTVLKFSPFHIPKTVVYNDLVSPIDDHILRPDFRVAGPISVEHTHLASLEPPSYASDIISLNNELRYKTEDLAQSCHSLVKEVQSLNWDFLNET